MILLGKSVQPQKTKLDDTEPCVDPYVRAKAKRVLSFAPYDHEEGQLPCVERPTIGLIRRGRDLEALTVLLPYVLAVRGR